MPFAPLFGEGGGGRRRDEVYESLAYISLEGRVTTLAVLEVWFKNHAAQNFDRWIHPKD